MKGIFFLFVLLASQFARAQATAENRNLVFDSLDLKIIQKADLILSDSLKWK